MKNLQLEKFALETIWNYVKKLEKNEHCELVYYKNALTISIVSKDDDIKGVISFIGDIPKNKKVIGNRFIGRGVRKSDLLHIIEAVFLES